MPNLQHSRREFPWAYQHQPPTMQPRFAPSSILEVYQRFLGLGLALMVFATTIWSTIIWWRSQTGERGFFSLWQIVFGAFALALWITGVTVCNFAAEELPWRYTIHILTWALIAAHLGLLSSVVCLQTKIGFWHIAMTAYAIYFTVAIFCWQTEIAFRHVFITVYAAYLLTAVVFLQIEIKGYHIWGTAVGVYFAPAVFRRRLDA